MQQPHPNEAKRILKGSANNLCAWRDNLPEVTFSFGFGYHFSTEPTIRF